jgi:hypothetical protein
VPRTHKIKFESLARALKEFDGDYAKVAEHFGCTPKSIRERVYKEPQLRAIWVKNGVEDPLPNEKELMVRKPIEPIVPQDKDLLDAVNENSRAVFNKDLESLLSNPDNVEKLQIFKEFDDSVGLLMADLELGGMDAEERILKTRLMLSACEQQGKFFDRMLKGLETMLKLTEKSEKKKKKKPGFMPLKELKNLEEAQ